MATIEATLDGANETSDTVSGARLIAGWQGSAMTSALALQVVRASGTGDFEVRFEGGVQRSGGTATTFDTVATITQDEANDVVTLTIAPGVDYRYRVESIAASTSVVVLAA